MTSNNCITQYPNRSMRIGEYPECGFIRPGFSVRFVDYGFFSMVIGVKHTILRPLVQAQLELEGYQLAPDCKWVDEGPPLVFNQPAAGPTDDEMPLGRVIKGEGWQAVLRRTKIGFEAIWAHSSLPAEVVLEILGRRNVPVAKDFRFVHAPSAAVLAFQGRFVSLLLGSERLLASVGLTPGMVNDFYRQVFGTPKLLELPEGVWAGMVNEVGLMVQSTGNLKARAQQIKRALGGV